MKSESYFHRALRHGDKRYARILAKLGYGTRDMRAITNPEPLPEPSEIEFLRAEYERLTGEMADKRWKEARLRALIAEAGKPAATPETDAEPDDAAEADSTHEE